MGTLVFQATLGGQVNLTGPNTASTFTISVPAVTGNMITSGDTGTVTNTMLAGSIANAKLLNSSVTIGSTAISLGATSTTLDGVNIGATTPGTGAFTTLSASSTTTLSGGTANGVAYLNGSKVLTTGSALTFDGTNLSTSGNVAISAYGSSLTLTSSGGSGSGSVGYTNLYNLTIQNNRGQNPYIDLIYNAGPAFGVNGTEGMRLTSTGLGIGTSSPARKLDVNGTIRVADGQSVEWGGTSLYIAGTSNTFLFGTSSAERMRLDSSGNLGLGVTPSAQYSTIKAMQIGALGATVITGNTSAGGTSTFGQNWYVDPTTANFFYAAAASQPASRYSQYAGQHQWFYAAAGTAGNAITFTQAMTLDASGNLLVGTTTNPDSRRMRVYGISEFDGSGVGLTIYKSSGTKIGSSGQGDYVVSGGPSDGFGIQSQTALVFGSGGTTERARIDSSGNLGVGTASPSASAIIDAQSTTKGVRFPNMTTTQKNAISSPAAGLVVFDTTLVKLCVYSGSAWQTITSI